MIIVALLATSATIHEGRMPPPLYVHFIALGDPGRGQATERIQLGEPFSVHSPELLSGRIQSRRGTLLGHLRGLYQFGTSFFDGEVQPEKSIRPTAIAFSGVLDLTYFVVSTNLDIKAFLRESPYEAAAAAP